MGGFNRNNMKNTTVSDIIAKSIYEAGIATVFAVPGVNVMPILEAIEKHDGLKLVICKTELGAAYMADAYARIKGQGCCIGTTGPGILNTVTGVAGSYYDSVPVLVISAEVSKNEIGKYGIQEMSGIGRTPNVLDIMKNITKDTCLVDSVSEVKNKLTNAIQLMRSGRKGPVYIEFYQDMLQEDCNDISNMECEFLEEEHSFDFSEMNRILDESFQKIVIIGNGARNCEAEKLLDFAQKIGASVVTTALAKGIISEAESINLGVIGCYGDFRANRAVERADTIVVLGATLGYLSTCGWSLHLVDKTIIRVDIDEEELKRNVESKLHYCNDIEVWISEFLKYFENNNLVYRKSPSDDKSIDLDVIADANQFNALIMKNISDTVSGKDVVIADVGQNAYWAERYIKAQNANFIIHGGMGAMGYGVAGSIGVQLALKDCRRNGKVVCVCGDGGYLMTGLELHTANIYKASVIWVVLNNHELGTQNAWANREKYKVKFDIEEVDIKNIAKSLGVNSIAVDGIEQFRTEFKKAYSQISPTLIEVNCQKGIKPKAYYGTEVKNINR